MATRGQADEWEAEFARWLAPFLAVLPRATHRKWAPRYVEGLLGPGERKSVERLADHVAVGDYDQLHHFLTTTAWDAAPLLDVLAEKVQALVGGPGAVLIIDDTTLLKQGSHSVGVARQYSGAAGKVTNCQVLVSLTLAQHEVPVPVALRLFLPKAWAGDRRRCRDVGVPAQQCVHREKWQLALEELDRVRAAGVTFGLVLADAGYGMTAKFRHGLTARGLTWAVGVPHNLQVYPPTVRLSWQRKGGGRRKHPRPLARPRPVSEFIRTLRWRRLTWRHGTKGPLRAQFTAARVRIGEGATLSNGWKVPGAECWLVGERRADGTERYYLTNLPAFATLAQLAAGIKARWSCEQAHQQMKEELGLDHFEGRSWTGLAHHVLLTMLAFGFLQHYRLEHPAPTATPPSARGENRRAAARAEPARGPAAAPRRAPHAARVTLPTLRRADLPRAA